MSKEPKEYLRHIQDECLYIISVTENLLYEDFKIESEKAISHLEKLLQKETQNNSEFKPMKM